MEPPKEPSEIKKSPAIRKVLKAHERYIPPSILYGTPGTRPEPQTFKHSKIPAASGPIGNTDGYPPSMTAEDSLEKLSEFFSPIARVYCPLMRAILALVEEQQHLDQFSGPVKALACAYLTARGYGWNQGSIFGKSGYETYVPKISPIEVEAAFNELWLHRREAKKVFRDQGIVMKKVEPEGKMDPKAMAKVKERDAEQSQ